MHNLTDEQISKIGMVIKLTDSHAPDIASMEVYKIVDGYKGYFWIDLRNYLVKTGAPYDDAFFVYSRATILFHTAVRAFKDV